MTDTRDRELPLVKLSLPDLVARARRGERLVMVTAYDAPSARLADAASVDMILVGDSAGTTVLGGDSTVPVTLDEMLLFTRAVGRGARRALVITDMPFGSYQISEERAVENAIRCVKEAGADAVKLEGAGRTLTRISGIREAGIPVMGHIGLTPQSATLVGGYKAQGRTAAAAQRLVDEARALERAGCFAIVLEAMPAVVAARITEAVAIPTIGIGAGAATDGQVLVLQDMLGMNPAFKPRFLRHYADGRAWLSGAVNDFHADTCAGTFPARSESYA